MVTTYFLCFERSYDMQKEPTKETSTVNSYVFKISPTIHYGFEKGYIKENIEFTHCIEQKEMKDIYTAEELEILLKRPKGDDFCEFRAWVIINVLIATGIRAKEL